MSGSRIYVNRLILLIVINLQLSSLKAEESKSKDVNEYCQWETFQPRCSKSEAILMTSATYGRMRIGRCITAEEIDAQRSLTKDDPRILDCSADVLLLLDKNCSGKSECDVRVFEIESANVKPCVPGLKVYLEASFSCIRVADERRSCAVTVSSDPTHVIITSDDAQRLCGSKEKPWTVEAPLGQRISVSLLDFGSSSSDQRAGRPCHKHGIIVEKSLMITTSICRGDERREELYQSKRNKVDIIFSDSDEKELKSENGRLILRLQAVGCSDILPPEDMWLKRTEDLIAVGCYSNRQVWRLNCTRGRWNGVIGNCTKGHKETIKSDSNELLKEGQSSLSDSEQVLAIVSICAFTVAICIAIVCIGAVFLRRFYLESKKQQDYKSLNCFVDPTKINFDSQRFSVEKQGKELIRSQEENAPTYSVWVDDGDSNCINRQNTST